MATHNGPVGEFFRGISTITSRVVAGGIILTATGALIVASMDEYYSLRDVAGFVGIGLVAVLGGGYVLLHIPGWLLHIWQDVDWAKLWRRLRREQEADAETAVSAVSFDWQAWVTETYKPGRRKWDLPVGLDDTQHVIECSMTGDNAHLIVNGRSGTGKSVLVNQLIIAAAMSGLYQVVVFCRSSKDYKIVERMRNVHIVSFEDNGKPLAENRREYSEQLLVALEDAMLEVSRRQNFMARLGKREMRDVRADQRPANVLLVLEEYSNARLMMNTEQQKLLDGRTLMLVQEARATAINACLIVQRASVDAVDSRVREQATPIVFKTRDATSARIATGINGSNAETLRVVDRNGRVPGECVFVSTDDTYRLTVPFTDGDMLHGAAIRHEKDVRFCGYPTWLRAFKVPVTSVTEMGVTDGRNSGESGTIPEVHQRALPFSESDVTALPDGDLNTVVAASIPSLRVTMPVPAAPAPVKRARPLSAQQVAKLAIRFFTEHNDFVEYRNSSSYTETKAQAVWLLLHGGMKKSEVSEVVFGQRGRYYAFVKLSDAHLNKMQTAWLKRQ